MLEQLLKEASTLEVDVQLDEIFESANFSAETKENFKIVYAEAVKTHALSLAESHIKTITESAEIKLAEAQEEANRLAEESLSAKANMFFDHLAEEWLNENKLAVDNSVKAQLFESMVLGMKELFAEHNIVVPEESVDGVSEMEAELAESRDEVSSLFESNVALKEELSKLNREVLIKESTKDLTESQKEKVASLTEGMKFDDQFGAKLTAIVTMVEGTKLTPTEDADTLNESSLNYIPPVVEDSGKPSAMDSYVKSARRIAK